MSYGTPSFSGPPPAYSPVSTAGPSTHNEPRDFDQIPDDFTHKVYVPVSEYDVDVRLAFMRKVYSILFAQLSLSTLIAGVMMYNVNFKSWFYDHIWTFYVAILASFVFLLLLAWKRRSYPLNYVFLTGFTLVESYTVGATVTFFDRSIVLQALILTTGIFIGLTLFTFQSKYDFSGMAPYLFGFLWVVVIIGFFGIFFPFGDTMDLIIAIGTAILFCGFIIYDTYNIMNRLSPEEYITASVDLYLDFVNLFIAILRILNDLNRD
ncbi:N-methyl-D-aspartate receptor glutamate-binding subunit [Rhizophagus irregularis]|uniref:N-methyl-D-aspartate receptor glutamate-binding subunit n=3 Tax=Rhizophagus irregularis TaxID=588596 RepID=U9UPV3_RHIID|nr:N-methyl-D-aspartate receptor glutamate-binding subunit [Rhizophagus irregularis DAOM 181602=DAOM 197198]EXX59569.1 Bxi1p [Rhizophagus irregularis DAOM 197198w]PKC12822.1 N-methyl-D-aspartate receptor glutamate-binding subunit [Rhizophagus irregularis]PKK72298.1 N-methyl-D-aspartate receptor glutamate-binding subunit [Rhizophagus irregularis]PKY21317.1 N-methyl-D-aspartate receptor glutamate-binding subunit [Rhizophagus irregularis]POG59565.1 N-methyl-D-aspartate receptor glutamate-binding |eukprot:XP_025166431.1 N-methyl-D-aspartate receptor glutamate-binding subunit [Rhizophagus irregularis DAOM 181602=DAOM 197198]